MTASGSPRGATARLRAADARLAKLIDRLGPLPPHRFFMPNRIAPFAALAQSVTHQQLASAAAEAIFKRLKKALGGRLTASRLLATPVEDLRAAGLSRGKINSLRDLASRTLDGTVPTRAQILELSDDEVVERLTSVHGIGLWTAEMLLLKLGRPDVLPATDYGIRRGFSLAFGGGELPHPKDILSRGERWRPHRSTASFYLWRATDGA